MENRRYAERSKSRDVRLLTLEDRGDHKPRDAAGEGREKGSSQRRTQGCVMSDW